MKKEKRKIKQNQTCLNIGLRKMKFFAFFLIIAILFASAEARKKQPKQTFKFDKRNKFEDQPVFLFGI